MTDIGTTSYERAVKTEAGWYRYSRVTDEVEALRLAAEVLAKLLRDGGSDAAIVRARLKLERALDGLAD